MPMLLRLEYRFLWLLEGIEIDYQQKDAGSYIKIYEYSEEALKKAIVSIARYYSIEIKRKIKRKRKIETKIEEHLIE